MKEKWQILPKYKVWKQYLLNNAVRTLLYTLRFLLYKVMVEWQPPLPSTCDFDDLPYTRESGMYLVFTSKWPQMMIHRYVAIKRVSVKNCKGVVPSPFLEVNLVAFVQIEQNVLT